MALSDKLKRKSQPVTMAPQETPPNYQYRQQQPPTPQPPMSPTTQNPYYWDGQRWVMAPQQPPPPAPQPPIPPPPPPFDYQQQQQRQVQANNTARQPAPMGMFIAPAVVFAMMAGGVLFSIYLTFLMKPFVSTTVIHWMPILLGMLFLMNGIGLFGLYLRKG